MTKIPASILLEKAKIFKSFWVFKGSSNFCQSLDYDIVSNKDTVEGGVSVVESEILKLLEAAVKIIEVQSEALEFYSQARILFLSKNGHMPQATNPMFGVSAGFESSEVHIKDDGNKARFSQAKVQEILGSIE